jgi:hypothetical protein
MPDPTNVVNPGLTNVADEAYDGFPSTNSPSSTTPSSNAGPTVRAADEAFGQGIPQNVTGNG